MHKGLKAGLLGCGSLVLLLALAAAGLVGWGAWREHAAIRDADALCASIVPGEPLEAVRARAAGFDFHYGKPIEINDLVAFVGARLGC